MRKTLAADAVIVSVGMVACGAQPAGLNEDA
jgi:hypothetical protein